MLSRARIGAVLVALVTSGFFITAADAAPNTRDRKLTVIQHNTDMLSPRPAIRAAKRFNADVITYQELCYKNLGIVKAAGYRVMWREQRARTTTSNGTKVCRKGNAIASRHAIANTRTVDLLSAGGRNFKLLCADLRRSGVAKATVCTTHFPLDYNKDVPPTGTENRVVVAQKIKAELDRRLGNGRRIILTGDFNDVPRSAPLNYFYAAPGGAGRFIEGDQTCLRTRCRTMQKTTSGGGRPIDYFFASRKGVTLSGIDKAVLKSYDPKGHYVIKGTVAFR